MAKGQSVLIETGKTPEGEKYHLYVVITNPDAESNVLLVPICTYHEDTASNPYPGQDDSCILSAGCHKFIKRKSYVKFHKSKIMNIFDIFNGIHKGKLIQKDDFDPEIIKDIQQGAEKSKFIPQKFKYFFQYFLS